MGRVLVRLVRLTLANAKERPSTPAPWIYTQALAEPYKPGKGEARGEEPAVAPADEAQRLRCAKAAPRRRVVVEEASNEDA